ncbi:unnamed protein product [Brachionus calyciflorus]|uniref:Eukaryotic translation initiation factor 3 subunit K n=1 Tax=Brachionus calyciflorus TaxID=104777 RepID=A0A813PL11_9BILA|nr:unnamed protein product [Brachionus calyciflorus]
MSRDWSQIDSMLQGIERYNPDNIPILEEYVQYQINENKYNLDANLALLKLYQFNPNHFQTLVTAHILLKALTNLPHSDFLLCKFLIDHTRMESEGLLSKIVDLSDLLERCQFREFWHLLKRDNESYKDVVSHVKGFENGIIEFILHIVSKTYQTIDFNELKEILGDLSNDELDKLIRLKSWKKQEDNFVFVANHEENIKTKNIVEKIKFEDVSSVISTTIRAQVAL